MIKITLEDIEKVMNQAGVDYKAAKEALLKASGDADLDGEENYGFSEGSVY
ncbi:hypothetical protein [Butyrivibrio sp. AC2005]|uniref:hypothetical protein n=1 Tax=Butyrivibrio sp. AC2005 TaxID=1280672 RepID=UPI0003F97C91|nr:hypothetical protein [Butyrivibrio sp. AC2005]